MKLKEAYAIIDRYHDFIFYNFEKKEIKLAYQYNSVIYVDDTNSLTKLKIYNENLPKILMEI